MASLRNYVAEQSLDKFLDRQPLTRATIRDLTETSLLAFACMCMFRAPLFCSQASTIPSKLKRDLIEATTLKIRAEEEAVESREDRNRAVRHFQRRREEVLNAIGSSEETVESTYRKGLLLLLNRTLRDLNKVVEELQDLDLGSSALITAESDGELESDVSDSDESSDGN